MKFKRNLFFLLVIQLLVGFGINSLKASDWEIDIDTDAGLAKIIDLEFSDDMIGWLIGDYGMVFKTFDGGIDWYYADINSKTDFRSIYCINNEHIFVGGLVSKESPSASLYETKDFGLTWSVVVCPADLKVSSINFKNYPIGFVSDYKGNLYKTEDGGITWELNFTAPREIRKILFHDNYIGYFIGGSKIYKTVDGGVSWMLLDNYPPESDRYYSLEVIDKNNVFVTGTNGECLNTRDGGITWIHNVLPNNITMYDIDFIDELHGWQCGLNGSIFRTIDGGLTWFSEVTPTNIHLLTLAFPNDKVGFAGGLNGLLLKTNIASAITMEDKVENTKLYPNPIHSGQELNVVLTTEPQTNITFTIFGIDGKKYSLTKQISDFVNKNNVLLKIPENITTGVFLMNVAYNGKLQSVHKIIVH